MKIYKLLFVAFLFMISCTSPKLPDLPDREDVLVIRANFYITEVYHGKHSIVKGYILYNSIKIPADTGYIGYYKKYNLKKGDVINVIIGIDEIYERPNCVTLRTSTLDLSNYMI